MNILIDVAGVVLIGVNVFLGARYGFLRRIVGLAGLYAGVAVAAFAGNSIAGWFYGSGRSGSLYADAWSFVIVTILVTAGVEVLGALYHEKLRAILSLMFDRTAAVVLGVVIGFFEIAVVCLVGLSTASAQQPNASSPLPNGRVEVGNSVKASVIGGRVNGFSTQMYRVFQPVMPNDLSAHLADTARVDVTQQAGS